METLQKVEGTSMVEKKVTELYVPCHHTVAIGPDTKTTHERCPVCDRNIKGVYTVTYKDVSLDQMENNSGQAAIEQASRYLETRI